jgi:hypothetical protein
MVLFEAAGSDQDEDDEEEERPHDLDDQTNLQKS